MPAVTFARTAKKKLATWHLALLCCLGVVSCVYGEDPLSLESTSNSCLENADCEQGQCVASVCSARDTRFRGLLLELIPPPANARFLGARYYLSVRADLENTELTIAPPITVGGEIVLSLGDPTCRPSPVEVTLVPVEAYLGINTVRYSTVSRVGTTIVDKKHVDTHTYQVTGVPAGTYDVWIRDAGLVDNSPTPACEVVPDVQRGIPFAAGRGRIAFNIAQLRARPLRVFAPSRAWEGFRVDVVNATTNEVLSSRGTLALTEDPTRDEVQAQIRLSTSEPDSNKMLLRLRPPSGKVAPGVSMVLAGLEVFEQGQALVPAIDPFEQPVTYETWAWRSLTGGPVPGKVHFTALELANVPPGVVASFDLWANIDEQGLVSELLPPGRYRADVSPRPGSGFSSASSEIVVWAPTSELPGVVQGGHVLQVSRAVELSGTIDAGGRLPPLGTQVRLLGIDAWPSSGIGIDRARSGRTPPNVSDLVSLDTFQLRNVDCGNCTPDARPLFYNLEVLPSEQSGFPRLLMPGVGVNGAFPLTQLKVDLPKVFSGKLVVNEPRVGPRGYPGVLVRAYALLSSAGEPLDDGVPGCWEESGSPTCASSVIEVASTYTGIDGAFRLLLPQGFTLPFPSNTDAGL